MEDAIHNDGTFRSDILKLRKLKDQLDKIPRRRKEHDVLLARYRKLLYETGGKYHMDAEDIVLNYHNV